jgi:hypothetical protein
MFLNCELSAHRPTPKREDHLLSAVRDYLFTKEDNMDIIKVMDMDVHEKFHSYKYNGLGECLNEQRTAGTNILFVVLLERCRHVGTPGPAA